MAADGIVAAAGPPQEDRDSTSAAPTFPSPWPTGGYRLSGPPPRDDNAPAASHEEDEEAEKEPAAPLVVDLAFFADAFTVGARPDALPPAPPKQRVRRTGVATFRRDDDDEVDGSGGGGSGGGRLPRLSPPRAYADPSSTALLQALKAQQVPPEFRTQDAQGRPRPVSVVVADYRPQPFPQGAFERQQQTAVAAAAVPSGSFHGAGQALGGRSAAAKPKAEAAAPLPPPLAEQRAAALAAQPFGAANAHVASLAALLEWAAAVLAALWPAVVLAWFGAHAAPGTAEAGAPASAVEVAGNATAPALPLPVAVFTLPTTKLSLLLLSGRRVTATLNPAVHTVADLRRLVQHETAAPDDRSSPAPWGLVRCEKGGRYVYFRSALTFFCVIMHPFARQVAGFPPEVILAEADALTLSEAKLESARVTQRLSEK
jgi:hypothetical protein